MSERGDPVMSKKACKLFKKGMNKKEWKEYKATLENPKYVCKNCGRAASKAANICKPEKL
jgi:hypothetical protein